MTISDVTRIEMKRAIIPSAATAFVAAIVLGTPEVITLLLLTFLGFTAAMIVLLVFCRLVPVAGWPLWKQRLGIWSLAAGTSALVCLLPLLIIVLKR